MKLRLTLEAHFRSHFCLSGCMYKFYHLFRKSVLVRVAGYADFFRCVGETTFESPLAKDDSAKAHLSLPAVNGK